MRAIYLFTPGFRGEDERCNPMGRKGEKIRRGDGELRDFVANKCYICDKK
jgi:hypothetical protein